MKKVTTKIAVLGLPVLFLLLIPRHASAMEKSIQEMEHKAAHLNRQAEEEYQHGNCNKSLKYDLEEIDLDNQINEFGGQRGYGSTALRIANCYAQNGDTENALKYYRIDTGAADGYGVAAKLGSRITACAVCSYNLITWDSLAHVYQLLADPDKATRAKAELALHTQANDTYTKAERKGSGLHFMDYIGLATASAASFGAARSGGPPPDASEIPHSDTDAEMKKATNRAWFAKMTVYKNANRPEYVAQVVQEMRNSQR